MDPTTFGLLVLAGVGTGIVGYLTGLASLVSYPALLAAGLSPVTANVTNTLGLVGIGVGTTARAGRRFRGERTSLLRQVAVAASGGLIGALLLLLGGEDTFAAIVPWLIILASLALLLQPWISKLRGEGGESLPVYLIALFVICIYGGYFGAGAGTIYLAVTLIATAEPFGRAMVLKSILLGVSNLIAAIVFIVAAFAFDGPVSWWAALALGLGCIVGGWLGPRLQDFLPERGLRVAVAICGLGLAVWLWLQ